MSVDADVRTKAIVLLRATQKILLEEGWCQGSSSAAFRTGPRDLLTAFITCQNKLQLRRNRRVISAAREYLNGILGTASLPTWNDAAGRTAADVDLALEQAIAALAQTTALLKEFASNGH